METEDWRRNPDAVEAALRLRMSALAHRVTGLLDRDAMLDVLAAPDFTGFLSAILRHLPAIEVEGDLGSIADTPDDFAERLIARRGSIPPDVDLDF